MADDPWAQFPTTPPPKPGPDWSGFSLQPPAEDTSIPKAVGFWNNAWAKTQEAAGQGVKDMADLTAPHGPLDLSAVPKAASGAAELAFSPLSGLTEAAGEAVEDYFPKLKEAQQNNPSLPHMADVFNTSLLLSTPAGRGPLVPTKTGELARVVQDDQGRLQAKVIGPPPKAADFDIAAKAIDPTGGMTPPAAEVKPSPITPIEGSPFAGVSRSIAAKTGIPEVDRVLLDLKNVLDNPVVDRTRDIPNSWGGSEPITNPTTYIDHRFPKELSVPSAADPAKMVTFDPAEPAVLHENVEEAVVDILTKAGMDQGTALNVAYHGWGNPVEHAWYTAHGIDPAAAEKVLRPILDKIATEKGPNVPTDLFRRTYPEGNPQLASAGDVPKPTPEEAAKGMQIVRDYQAANPPRTVADKLKDGWQTYGTHPYESAEAANRGVVAYHGSPYDFDAFDSGRIGTGEGAQSYGHGLYFAEHPEVADQYKDALRDRTYPSGSPEFYAVTELEITKGDRAQAIENLKEFIGRLSDGPMKVTNEKTMGLLKAGWEPAQGNKYQVKIHANKDDFLDLDKPLNEQTPKIQAAVKRAMGIDHEDKFSQEKSDRIWKEFGGSNAQTAIRNGFIAFSDDRVSKLLSDAGIPGSKYLDQESRTRAASAPIDAPRLEASIAEAKQTLSEIQEQVKRNKDNPGLLPAYFERRAQEIKEVQASIDRWQARLDTINSGSDLTHNLVVFDHNIVEITHKNGEVVPSNHLVPMARDLSSASTPMLPLPPRPSKNFIQDTDNNFFRIRQAHVADQSEMLNLIDKLPSNVKDAELQEKWYRYGEGDTTVHLTPEEGKLYNEVMIPLQKEQRQLWEEAKKTDLPVEEYNPYMHRVVKGKTPQIDRLAGEGAGEANPIYNGPGLLARSTSSMHERKFFALENESGERQLITLKDIQHLSETPDVPLKVGDQIQAEQTYTIRQALTREIEENSSVRYYKNALVNTIDNILHLRAVNRAIFEIQKLRDTPEWAKYTTSSYGNDVFKKGWIQPQMPLFRNDFMDPKLAHVLDDFYGRVPTDGLQATLEKINHYATGSMFWTPVPHAMNAAEMWVTERGWDNVTPQGMRSLMVDGAAAIRHVVTQSKKYQQILREGGALQYGRVVNQDFYQQLLKRSGSSLLEMDKNEQGIYEIAKVVGMTPVDLVKSIYNGASNSLWAVSDMFAVQRILELERKGMSTREAIDASEKIMANYRVPSEILGSRSLQQVYTNPILFQFSRYHYSKLRGFANLAKGLAVGTPKEKFDSIGRIMAMGTFHMLVWPAAAAMLTLGYQELTGDKTTKIRPGPSGFGTFIEPVIGKAVAYDPKDFPQFIRDYYHNDDDLMRQLMNLIPMSPMLKFGEESYNNRYDYSGKPIVEPSDVRNGRYGQVAGQMAEHAAGSLISPYSTISQAMKQGASIPQKIIEGAFGLQEHTDKQEEARAKAFHYQDKEAARRKPQGLIEGLTK